MARCIDCGREDTAEYLISGFCEDCIEYHDSPDWFDDEANFPLMYNINKMDVTEEKK